MHINDLFSLSNKCAVVIGGAGKIGFPMSEALAEAGAKVFIVSTNKSNYETAVLKLKKTNLDTQGLCLDQTNEKSVKECIEFITKNFKVPDILVNCGVERPMKKYFEDSVESWDRSMEVNARGLFITCREFGKRMAKQKSGSIINVASIYGVVAPDQSIYENTSVQTEPDYPYTKGGMIMFSKYLASLFAKDNVRVNSIVPGGFFNNQEEPFLSRYTKKVPMGRMAYHDDLKGITVFLASNASNYITGTVIAVDGGFTII